MEAADVLPTSATVTVAKPEDIIEHDLFGSDCCSICLDPFTDEDPAKGTRCGHGYHLQCILQWSQRSDDCPLCCGKLELTDPMCQELLAGEQAAHQRIVEQERAHEESRMLNHMELERFFMRLSVQASMLAGGEGGASGRSGSRRPASSANAELLATSGRTNEQSGRSRDRASEASSRSSAGSLSRRTTAPVDIIPPAPGAGGAGTSRGQQQQGQAHKGSAGDEVASGSLDTMRSRMMNVSRSANDKIKKGGGGLRARMSSLFS